RDLTQIENLLAVDADVLRLAAIIDVRGADEREFPLVRECKHDATIAVLEDVGKTMREQLRHDDMTALDQPDAMARSHRGAALDELGHPGSGCVDHDAGAHHP